MRRSNFALRLQSALLEEVRSLAKAKGMSLNRLINIAVAEKVSALRAEDYLGAGADSPEAVGRQGETEATPSP
jgi:hypothetical protein